MSKYPIAGEASIEAASISELTVQDHPVWSGWLAKPGYQTLWRLLLLLIGVAPGIATFVGFFGGVWWRLDLLSHFRWQYTVLLLLAILLSVLAKRYRLGMVLAVPLAINVVAVGWLYLPIAHPHSSVAGLSAPTLRLMQFNVFGEGNEHYEEGLGCLARSGADLIFVQEVNPAWLAVLGSEACALKVEAAQALNNNFGIALLVPKEPKEPRWEVLSAKVVQSIPGYDRLPAIEVTVCYDDQEVALLNIHALPPTNGLYAGLREQQYDAIARWVRAQQGATVLIGDLNATPWSAAFRGLVGRSGLMNSQQGFGYQGTWPTHTGLLGSIPIDHCLHSKELYTLERSVGLVPGSDHRPLYVTLGLGDSPVSDPHRLSY